MLKGIYYFVVGCFEYIYDVCMVWTLKIAGD